MTMLGNLVMAAICAWVACCEFREMGRQLRGRRDEIAEFSCVVPRDGMWVVHSLINCRFAMTSAVFFVAALMLIESVFDVLA